jgi:hypothetical protein
MAIFLRYEAQDEHHRLSRFGEQTSGEQDGHHPLFHFGEQTGGADGPTTNEHICSSCRSLTLEHLVALKASVGLYLPYIPLPKIPKFQLIPTFPCALCTLCGTHGVGGLISDQEALEQCKSKRKTLRTAIGLSSRPPEKEFEQLAIKWSSGHPQTIGVAAEYGKEVKDFMVFSRVF